MWILRYLILATRQRCNALLDRRTRMNFDPLHGCPMHVCADKAEWDRRGREQVAQLESELRQDIEAYHTKTGERRVIAGETIEVRPVIDGGLREVCPEPAEAGTTIPGDQSQLQTGAPSTETEPGDQNTLKREQCTEETILPETAPETEAVPAHTGDALVSSGVEAKAEAEPGAEPTFLGEAGQGDARPEPAKAGTTLLPEAGGQNQSPSDLLEVPEPTPPTPEPTPKAKTKSAGKAGKK